MPKANNRKISSCLFEDGPAVVMGLPPDFNLCASIENATEIRLATAFANPTGWRLINHAILKSHAVTRLLTGTHFCQTHPDVLQSWSNMSAHKTGVEAKVYAGNADTFHPKVLMVSSGNEKYAIVGSANLSRGGFQTNVECSIYVSQPQTLDQLTHWFDSLYMQECIEVDDFVIREYQLRYEKNKRLLDRIRGAEKKVNRAIHIAHKAELEQWEQAVRSAKTYFKSDHFARSYENRKLGLRRLKRALSYPKFTFGKQGLDAFYAEGELGGLDPRWKKSAWRSRTKLQRGLRKLIESPDHSLAAILDANGSFHSRGVGLAFVSKVLAVHDARSWPVFNRPVRDTLAQFGYKTPGRASRSIQYSAFSEMTRRFMKASAAKDMLALDCFFYWYSRVR